MLRILSAATFALTLLPSLASAQECSDVSEDMVLTAARFSITIDGARVTDARVPSGLEIATSTDRGTYLYVDRATRTFAEGLYELVETSSGGELYHFDPVLGRTVVPVNPPSAAPHTPLGDDMCEDAPALIMDYCLSFVACAAYDLFC